MLIFRFLINIRGVLESVKNDAPYDALFLCEMVNILIALKSKNPANHLICRVLVLFDIVFCDPAGIRTQDPYIKSVLLYQLSYGILSVFESDAKVEFLLIYAKL